MDCNVTVYKEDIYVGYRYFDSFKKKPLFAFGYGLSYTEFEIESFKNVKRADGAEIIVKVKNVGSMAGKEVVQLYVAARCCRQRYSPQVSGCEHPSQELKAFEKTRLLQPGEEEHLFLVVPWRELACYMEDAASYVIEQGEYQFRIGNSSRNTRNVQSVFVEQDILVEQCENRLGIQPCNQGKLDFLVSKDTLSEVTLSEDICAQSQFNGGVSKRHWFLCPEDIEVSESPAKEGYASDIVDKVKDLSIEQLAALCVGYGPGTPFSAFGDGSNPETIFDEKGNALTSNSHPVGFNGYVSPAIPEKGIESIFYKDGPAGIGEIAWPAEMLTACAFDKKLGVSFKMGW